MPTHHRRFCLWSPLGPRSSSLYFWSYLVPACFHLVSTCSLPCSPVGLAWSQLGPNLVPTPSSLDPRWLPICSPPAPRWPAWYQMVSAWSHFTFRLIWCPLGSPLYPLAPFWSSVDPAWSHLGPRWLPTCSPLAPHLLLADALTSSPKDVSFFFSIAIHKQIFWILVPT